MKVSALDGRLLHSSSTIDLEKVWMDSNENACVESSESLLHHMRSML